MFYLKIKTLYCNYVIHNQEPKQLLTTVNVDVKKQNVFITCSGIPLSLMHLMCSPIYCLDVTKTVATNNINTVTR